MFKEEVIIVVESNLALSVFSLSIIILLFISSGNDFSRRGQRMYLHLLGSIAAAICLDILGGLLNKYLNGQFRILLKLMTSSYFILVACVAVFVINYIDDLVSHLWLNVYDNKSLSIKMTKYLPISLLACALFINFFTNFMFDITPTLGYVRGEYFAIYTSVNQYYLLYMILLAVGSFFKANDDEQRVTFSYILVCLSLPMIGFILQMYFHMAISMPMIVFSCLMIHFYVQEERVSRSFMQIRKQTDEIIQKDSLITLLGNTVNVGISTAEINEEFTYHHIDESLPRFLGYSMDEFLAISEGKAVGIIYPPDMIGATTKLQNDFKDKDSSVLRYRVVCKDGTLPWVIDYCQRFVDTDGVERLVSMLMFMNENRRIKEELEQTNKIIENSYAVLTNGVVRYRVKGIEYSLISVNNAALELFDVDSREHFIENWHHYTQGEGDFECLAIARMAAMTLEKQWDVFPFTTQITHRDGAVCYIEGVCILLSDNADGKEILVTANDVTDGVLLTERLKSDHEAKLVLDNVYETITSGILRTKAVDGAYKEVVMANKAAIEMLGYSSYEELCANREFGIAGTILEEDRAMLIESCNQLVEQWDSVSCKYRVRHKDGTIHVLRSNYTLITKTSDERIMQSISYDITLEYEQAQLKDQARRQAYLDQIFSILSVNTKDAYVLFTPENKVEYVSPNIERLTGISAEELAKDLRVLRKETINREEALKQLAEITDEKPLIMDYERTHLKTGETRLFKEIVYRGYLDEKTGYLLILSDQTENIRAQQALEQALDSAKVASEAKTMFLSAMSHDIRTPMNAITGLITLLKKDYNKPEKIFEHLDQLDSTSEMMLELINNILDMARIESGKIVLENNPIDIKGIHSEVKNMYLTQAELKDITVFDETDINYDSYLGDEIAIKKILINLFSNATKYTNAGGTIKLISKSLGVDSNGYDLIRFTIEDNGVGMSHEFMEHMFDPFEREANTTATGIGGTGLGMSIVKNIIELMGGTINVFSEKNVGTTIVVEIPMKPSIEIKEEAVVKENVDIDVSGINLLVVEDNELNAMIIMELLEMEGVSTRRAENGQIAYEMFMQASEDEYDAILMDIQMPVLNGYDATQLIRSSSHARAASIPIIALTANAFKEDVQNALNAGMNAHISKPIKMDVLKRTLAKYISINK